MIVPATGNVTAGMRTSAATTGFSMSADATFKMSDAVDTDAGLTPLASAKWVLVMPSSAAAAFILATKAAMLPASQFGEHVGVVVRRVDEQPAQELCLAQLLPGRHQRAGVVLGRVVVVVAHIRRA